LPARKEFLTTGEAADLLHLSPSTVIRRFEKGDLTGRRHPVTGKRLISKQSLLKFMEAHHIPTERLLVSKRRILVATTDESHEEMIKSVLAPDTEIEVRPVHSGAAVCGVAFQWRPDLIVIDANLPDMDGRDVIRCLRNLPPLKQTKVVLSSDPDLDVTKTEIAELSLSDHWIAPWDPGTLSAKLHHLLGIGPAAEPSPAFFQHKRKHPRVPANWPAALKLSVKGQAKPAAAGAATVRNLSRGGAFLSDIRLSRGSLPAQPFTLEFKVRKGAASGLAATCRPVRIETDEKLGMAVEFLHLPSRGEERLAWALGA